MNSQIEEMLTARARDVERGVEFSHLLLASHPPGTFYVLGYQEVPEASPFGFLQRLHSIDVIDYFVGQ
jgi:hypothetical protein